MFRILTEVPDTPQNIALNITSYVTIIVALITLAGTFISRKVKSPADELARADFAYKKISERLDEVNKDRTYLQSVIDTLRVQLGKLDADASLSLEDKRQLRDLVTEGEERIRQLARENEILNNRLGAIGDKVRLGLPITLSDVYGIDNDTPTPEMEDIELTIPPESPNSPRSLRRELERN